MLPPDWQTMGEAAKLFTRSLMMGLDSAVRKAEFDEPTAEDIENMPYHEAVEYLKKRDVIKKVDYDSLSDKMRFRAFTASRIADGDLLKKLNAEMIASVNDGKGLSDFLSLTKTGILDKIGMGAGSGWYWETVWRTNTQTAFNVGRAMGFAEDKPLALELVIIDDSRTSDVCRQYAGKRFILPYDHPFWQTHWPPFHFNCRTTIRAIYDESELPENWSNPKDIEDSKNGFGAYPLAGDGWWNELASQVARAKEYGVQGEILGAKSALGVDGVVLEPDNIGYSKPVNSIEDLKTMDAPLSIEESLKQVNPNYKKGFEWQNNCQRCCPTYEAIRRKYDVLAKPTPAKTPTELNLDKYANYEKNGFAIMYKDAEVIKAKGFGKNEILQSMKEWGDGARCEICVVWKRSGAHVFMAEQVEGKTIFLDPQTNTVYSESVFDDVRKTYTKYFRTDNLDFNDNIIDCCLNRKEARK